MSEPFRFVIATDNPERALADMLCCAPTNAPKWVRVLSDPQDILAIEDGTLGRGVWYSAGGAKACAAEWAWRERRLMGGIRALSSEDEDRIAKWVEQHRARVLATIASGNASSEALGPTESALPHREHELQNLVLTQRWV